VAYGRGGEELRLSEDWGTDSERREKAKLQRLQESLRRLLCW